MSSNIIEVTQDDIADGRLQSVMYCPIALALKRKYNTDSAQVTERTASAGHMFCASLTKDVIDWIMAYDREEEVQPINLDLFIGEYGIILRKAI